MGNLNAIVPRWWALLIALSLGWCEPAFGNRMTSTMEFHDVPLVGYDWVTVEYDNAYAAPVIVCTYVLASSANPSAITRVRIVEPTSFDVKIQQFEDSSVVTPGTVFCIVSETGAHSLPGGVQYEAGTVQSDETSGNTVGWQTSRTEDISSALTLTYSNPVLVGMVMSYNDTLASSFFATDCENRANRPFQSGFSDGACVGKHIGQINGTRATETLGYFVFESGTGNANDIFWQAGRTPDNVRGVSNGPPFTNSVSRDFDAGVATSAGEDGGQGGWWVFYGADPLPSGEIRGAIDEEVIAGDTSRSHTTEEINFFLIEDNNTAELALQKSAPVTEYNELGQVISFSFEIENTGTTTVSDITLEDDQIGTVTCPSTSLAVGADMTCTANYEITSDDLTNGSVTNIATVDGDPDFGKLDPQVDTWTLTYSAGPASLTVEKTLEYVDPAGYSLPGEDVIYQIVVTNEGSKSPDDGTLFLVDELPAEVELFGGNFEASGGPVSHSESGTGLSFAGAIGFATGSTRPEDMTDCSATPAVPYDQTVTYVCIAPTGTFAGANPDPSFTIRFRARLK